MSDTVEEGGFDRVDAPLGGVESIVNPTIAREVDGEIGGEKISEKNIVLARGTEDGLVLRIDGKAEWSEILSEIRAFLGTRRRFLEGGQVSVEWLERLPTKEQLEELEGFLQTGYGIAICARRRRPVRTTITVEKGAEKGERTRPTERREGSGIPPEKQGEKLGDRTGERRGVTVSIFDQLGAKGDQQGAFDLSSGLGGGDSLGSGSERSLRPDRNRGETTGFGTTSRESRRRMDKTDLFDPGLPTDELEAAAILDIGADGARGAKISIDSGEGRKYVTRVASILGEDLHYEEDANAKIFYGTLRSGQRVETPFSLVVVGDVNPGADLVAGGDIIVLGSLRGTAHAAAYDDDCQDRVIFALQMQPMQLRIGSVISRGSGEAANSAEVARVENRRIIVEAFQARTTGVTRGGSKKLR